MFTPVNRFFTHRRALQILKYPKKHPGRYQDISDRRPARIHSRTSACDTEGGAVFAGGREAGRSPSSLFRNKCCHRAREPL